MCMPLAAMKKRATIADTQLETKSHFVARGIASLKAAERSGCYIPAETVVAALQARLDEARAEQQRRRTAKP